MSSTARRLAIENLELRRLLAAVNIPTDLTGQVGAEVATPVNIDNAAGVRGAEIRLAYDPAVFTLDQDDITAGTSWASAADTLVVANVDTSTGNVIIFVSAATELPSGTGSLVVLGFRVRDNVAVDTQSAIDLIEVRLNEGAIPVNPSPVAGPDPTDGRVVVVGGEPGQADRISGIVYADTNGDNAPSQFEGIPGVVITLVNVATNETRETVTGDDGQFEFLSVPAGSYRIVQTQPTAFIDGGNNELTVTLAVGQNLTNQNFREIGLRAAYLYNRLAMTSTLPVGSPAWIETIRQINVDAAVDAVAQEVQSDPLSIASQAFFAPTASPLIASTPTAALPPTGASPIAMSLATVAEGEGESPQSQDTGSSAAPAMLWPVPQPNQDDDPRLANAGQAGEPTLW